jgi:hypothetical protein
MAENGEMTESGEDDGMKGRCVIDLFEEGIAGLKFRCFRLV